MQLYEATNGFTGYGPVRCYVWAEDKKEAKELAEIAFQESDQAEFQGGSFWENINLQLIVDTEVDKESFYTDLED